MQYEGIINFIFLRVYGIGENLETSKVVSLKCEYIVNPLGIDTSHPRLTWQMVDTKHGAMQTAYQIKVGKDEESILKGIGDYWDSGKIESQDILVKYAGLKLKPWTKYFWTVTIWDNKGNKMVA